jgi:hypothetical protein
VIAKRTVGGSVMKPGGILNEAGSSLTISSIVTGTGLAFFTGPGDGLKLLLLLRRRLLLRSLYSIDKT